MKKKMRRLISFTLALFLVLSLLPTSALAEETAEQTTTEKGIAYFASETEQVLGEGRIEGSVTRKPVYAEKDNGYYTDVEEAIALLRERMVHRWTYIKIPLRVSKAEVSGETEMEALIAGIFALATAHTGVADEGDYLLWQIKDLTYSATYNEGDSYYYLDITYDVHYYTSSNAERNFASQVESVLAGFGFTEETDDYTKILSIYTFICDTVSYDYENLENESYTDKFTAETALRDGKAVCQGYALLLYYMLLSVGIDCRIIAGYDAETGGAHAWNIVQLDGAYYNLDSTWDAGYYDYWYFLKSPAAFTDHIRDAVYDSGDFHTLYPMAQEDYALTIPMINSGSCGENAQYTLYADGYLEITGTDALRDWDNEQAPWKAYSSYVRYVFVDEGITRVGDKAFSNIPFLLVVDLPKGLKSIGDSAFYNSGRLETVLLPSTLSLVEIEAFSECRNLKTVLITDLTEWCRIDFASIGANPLAYGADLYLNEEKVTELIIPNSITQIKPYAFCGGSFASVTFHSGVKEVGAEAFYNCTKLTQVHISDLAAWCSIDFNNFTSAWNIANPLSLGAGLYLNGSLVTELVIPNGVTSIGASAFYGSAITSVTIPSSVTEIGASAFGSCEQMKRVYITDLPAWCKIDFADIEANPLYNKAGIYLNGQQITDLVIDTSVAAIEPYAFAGADIASAIVTNPSAKIGANAFAHSLLTSLTLSEGITELGERAFAYSALETLSLPTSLKVIAPYAFYETALTSLVLPEGVTEVGTEAFSRCLALAEITVPTTLRKVGDRAFHRFYSAGYKIRNVYITDLAAWCKMELGESYLEASPIGNEAYLYLNGEMITELVIPEGIEVLGPGVFAHCRNEMTVILPKSLTRIEDEAFAWLNCKDLCIPENVTYIGIRAFYDAELEQIIFMGDAPDFTYLSFDSITATAYYPTGNPTWTAAVRQSYGGEITWVAACTAHSFENGVCTICGEKDPDFKPGGLLGDADGSGVVDYVDAMLVLQYHTGVITNEALALAQCDVDASGAVDYVDAMRILQYHTGVISGF